MKTVAALVLALAACHQTPTQAPPEESGIPLADLAQAMAPKPAPIELPSDGQVRRDTARRIIALARMGGIHIDPAKFVITKAFDQYEKDEANATVAVSPKAYPWFRVTAVYQRVDGFWKLRGLSD